MLAFRDQWLIHLHCMRTGGDGDLQAVVREILTDGLRRLVERDLVVAAKLLAEMQTPELMAAARYVANFNAAGDHPLLNWISPLGSAAYELGRWRALAVLLLTKEGKPRTRLDKNVGFPDLKEVTDKNEHKVQKSVLKGAWDSLHDNPRAVAALHSIVSCPAPEYTAADLATIEAFVEVLIKAYGYLWVVFQEAGETDFVEVAGKALTALGDDDEPSDLALKLDYSLSHLLVDEFQDTNHHQISLLERLTAGWTPQDGRTLFVVGDPMQSIYRFRKADVGLFLRAWSGGIGAIKLHPLKLYRNNRSLPNVIAWINASFPTIFPESVDPERGMVTYSPAIATKPEPKPGIASGTVLHPIVVGVSAEADPDEENGNGEADDGSLPADLNIEPPEDGDELEAQEILDIIDTQWADDPERSIAILVRARNHLGPLVAEIRRSKPTLRYEAVEIESLAERQPIQDLMALTRAISHRGDRVNWLAILRAPWCGLTLADLFHLAQPERANEGDTGQRAPVPTIWSLMQDNARIAKLSADGQHRVRHACDALRNVVETPGRVSLRRQVESVWLRLGGNLCVGSQSDVEDVGCFFRLLDKLDASGRFDLDRLEAEIKDLFAAPSTDKQAGKLKFMTVHKAKGLEFDTVILPGLHRKAGRDEPKLLLWEGTSDETGGNHLVVAPYKRVEDDDSVEDTTVAENSQAIRSYINKLEKARLDQESRRVLYVATTRAIRSLHLLGVSKAKRSKKTGAFEVATPKAGTPLSILWPSVSDRYDQELQKQIELRAIERTDPTDQQPQCDIADFIPQLRRLRSESLPQPATVTEHLIDEPGVSEMGSPYHAESSLAPHVGTLVHRYLELIVLQGLDEWDEARVRALRPVFQKWLTQQGHESDESIVGGNRVESALVNAITDSKGRWILQAREDAACELAITSRDENAMRNNIVDRTFVEEGKRWVIDYKTGQHTGGNVDEFIAAKRGEYADQLERYASIFKQDGLEVRKAIYFVDLNRFEPV
jgi:ATP-dependent exoDNAse (exonuclease V) beta subunit